MWWFRNAGRFESAQIYTRASLGYFLSNPSEIAASEVARLNVRRHCQPNARAWEFLNSISDQ